MSLSNQVTARLNGLEEFVENSPFYYFPLKLLAWMVLFLALIITNFLAILNWPISSILKRVRKGERQAGEPLNITSEDELNQLISKHDFVLADFWAEWCGPCLLMNNAINVIAQKYTDNFLVVKVDISVNLKLGKCYSVKSLPTVIVFKNGLEAVRKSGALTVNQLSRLVDETKS